MSENIKNTIGDIPTPTLSFEPLDEQLNGQEQQAQSIKPVEKSVMEESKLTAEEQKMVDEFAGKIELRNSNVILQYGVGAQKKMADFSEDALNNVRNKDLGEVGDMLSNVVMELKGFEADEEDKGLFGFFKKGANKEIGRAHV